jgi:O-antigen ligase
VAPPGSFSVAMRLVLVHVALDMAARHPVFGVGPFNFRPLLYGDPRYQSMFAVGVVDVFDAHNFYLTTLATLGPIGLLLLLAALYLSARRLLAVAAARQVTGAVAALGVLGALVVGGFFGFSLLDPASDVVFGLLLAAVVVWSEPVTGPERTPAVPGLQRSGHS